MNKVSKIIKETFLGVVQPNEVIEKFNEYNTILEIKVTHMLDAIKSDVGYSTFVGQMFIILPLTNSNPVP